MRVVPLVMLGCALWLLAEATALDPRTVQERYEAGECVRFQSLYATWRGNRAALINRMAVLHEQLAVLPWLRTTRCSLQWACVVISFCSLGALAWAGWPLTAAASLWIGFTCLCGVDYYVKTYNEGPIHASIRDVQAMASVDASWQTSMVAQQCDNPPFVGIDETPTKVEAFVATLRPEPWTEHYIDLNVPSNKELREGRESVLAMHEKLKIKFMTPIDPPTRTLTLSAEQAAAARRGQQGNQ